MKPQESSKPLTSQDALNVLSAWTALEVLSPTSFVKPEELNNNDKESVIYFDGSQKRELPWESGMEIAPEGKKIFYQIILGTLDLKKCMEALIQKYGEEGVEFPLMTGDAIMAIVVVDEFGYLVTDKTPASLSSYAWGVPKALSGNLRDLSEWSSEQNQILIGLNEVFFAQDYGKEPSPLTVETLNIAYEHLITTLNIPDELLGCQRFSVRVHQPIKKNEKTESPWSFITNSFFLNDLA